MTEIPSLHEYELAHQQLRRDAAYPYLSSAERVWYIERSLAIGRAVALQFVGRNPSSLAHDLGARIVFRDAPLRICGERVRSEYDTGTRIITICRTSVAQVQALLDSVATRGHDDISSTRVSWQRARHSALDLHIAHELFHHLEATGLGRVDERLPRISTGRIGPFWIGKRRIAQCREIAAPSAGDRHAA